MIGGFDQFHFLKGCIAPETRREVRPLALEAAGAGGGYVLSPSDHFFEAEPAPAGGVRRRSAAMRVLSREVRNSLNRAH